MANCVSSSDLDDGNIDKGERRSARQRLPNSKYVNDFVLPTNSRGSSRVCSPKRAHSRSDRSRSDSKPEASQVSKPKRSKSDSKSIKKQESTSKGEHRLAAIGNLQLRWPRYGIKDATYEGDQFTVFNTCPLDTGLFTLYNAFEANSNEFRDLFNNENLPALNLLRCTFRIVDTNGWTNARLFWLIENDLLQMKNFDGEYDIENTLNHIVFQFVQPIQMYPLKSKCSCKLCPKRIRQTTSIDIALM
jgi:hypothetical protein